MMLHQSDIQYDHLSGLHNDSSVDGLNSMVFFVGLIVSNPWIIR